MTLSEEDQAHFKAMWNNGVDINPICHRFGITVSEMNRIAFVLGLRPNLQFAWDDEKEAELSRLVDNGLSLVKIAEKIGCSKETARRKKAELFPTIKNYWEQPEKIADLKKLVEQGQSASQIAKELGCISRNAVIGKVHRMGLSFKKATGPRKTVLKTTKRLPKKSDAPKFNYPVTPIKTIENENAKNTQVFELQPGEDYVSLIEHKESQCRCVREIDGKFVGFCAKLAEPGSSYCKEHGERFQTVVKVNKFRMKEGKAA